MADQVSQGAWCRSFMQERIHSQQDSGLQLGQSVLYFGCRHADQDYLYGTQLQQWSQQGSLTLFTAFSRQQVSAGPSCSLVCACMCPQRSHVACGTQGSHAAVALPPLYTASTGGAEASGPLLGLACRHCLSIRLHLHCQASALQKQLSPLPLQRLRVVALLVELGIASAG